MNSAATAADISSAPAASTAVVGAAAAALAAVIVEPMLSRSNAAEANISGTATRYDIVDLHRTVRNGPATSNNVARPSRVVW